jgi:hypothetical protein
MGEFTLTQDIRELTFSELDEVSGGDATVSANLVGDAVVNGTFHIDQLPGVFSVADISASMQVFSGIPILTLSASAST